MNFDKRDNVGRVDERITLLREFIRHAFPAERFDGNVTKYDDEVSSELTEDQDMLDEDQDLFRALSGRKWTEVPRKLIQNLPSGYRLLSDEAFGSSAAAHCGLAHPDPMLDMERWRKRWTLAEWRRYLGEDESAAEVSALRQATHTGRPMGSAEFIEALEQQTLRPLAPRKPGRPKKAVSESLQMTLTTVA